MTADTPDLTVAEFEQIREATIQHSYTCAIDLDFGRLVDVVNLAIARTKQLGALRAETQQNYSAIHAKQQRDAERIRQLEVTLSAGEWVFSTADVEKVLADGLSSITPARTSACKTPSRAPADVGRTPMPEMSVKDTAIMALPTDTPEDLERKAIQMREVLTSHGAPRT
ncbi:hypothetical protein [Nocardia thailandica]|uniref:hypothetical protein n=1 Tax=Nocardia thailandica TaxID=257275 RepID=UPI0002FA1ECA|nr:hypothetical protein [Nocardia thailandica]